ncbi:unnamed protein product [Linum tenue]|uniref:Peptidase C1A papain C-terminal domain-containing protein n=1 Tax=Linum tenue TaxID=586396 RepID=A0AAV0RD30_9ROSI|nr:unnamed protein product [Linum tenue]
MLELRLMQGSLSKKAAGAMEDLISDANFDCSSTSFGHQTMGLSLWPSYSAMKEHFRYDRPSDLGADAPLAVDWTDEGWLQRAVDGKIILPSPIRDQSDLATCGCHAVAAALEAAHNILNRDKEPVSLSVQELIDHSNTKFEIIPHVQLKTVAKIIKREQLSLESHYPYRPGKKFHPQRKLNPSKVVGIRKIEKFETVVESEILKLVERQPVIMILNLGSAFENWKSSGVYKGPDPGIEKNNGHAVLIVGYGTTNSGINFWKIKNSSGKHWGEDGYCKICRASRNILILHVAAFS